MENIIIFGGTSEGRRLADTLQGANVKVCVCVATEYGDSMVAKKDNIDVHTGKMDKDEIISFVKEKKPTFVIDATHPFAKVVTGNVSSACMELGVSYLRLKRGNNEIENENILSFDDLDSAIEFLKSTTGKIFITTGSNELHKFTEIADYKNRCFARVLSTLDVVSKCKEIGFEGGNISFMQGPFSKEFNVAQIKMVGAKYLVTKSSGNAGGVIEKINAASEAGCKVVLIQRPDENINDDCIKSFDEICEVLKNKYTLSLKKQVAIIGIGMGSESGFTKAGYDYIKSCDLIIGAKRIVESCISISEKEVDVFYSYKSDEIVDKIEKSIDKEKIAIVFSGDVGFYSGWKNLLSLLDKYSVEIISGIASPVYFLDKIGKTWEDVNLCSIHGKNVNVVSQIRRNLKTFMLLGEETHGADICKKLTDFGLGDTDVWVGENLSYDNETITYDMAKNLTKKKFNKLSVIYIENKNADDNFSFGINDDEFIRGKVPMTKSEIRALTLEKLQLKKSSIVYDIGAGTGSVSVEAALYAYEGTVFSIEKNPQGIELITQNANKFMVDNVIPVLGSALEQIKDLPTPTHVFIGGSSGDLKEIINQVRLKNKNAKIVFNCISLETLTEVFELIKNGEVINYEIVNANISKSKILGNYNMMTANNPIYIISGELG